MSDCCGGGIRLIYACSGAADVGELSDRLARKLIKEGFGTKTCLAAIGARISGYVESAKGAELNIAIDGCQIACAKKALELIGVTPASFILTDMGYVKGQTEVTAGIVEAVAEKIRNDEALQKGKGGCGC